MNPISVLIVDDQALIREGLCALLNRQADIEIVGCATNGREAYHKTLALMPNVILMDISMPEVSGVDATRIIKDEFPEIVIIMLTTFDNDEYIIQAMSYGASGYLLKDITGEALVAAIRNGFHGNIVFPGKIAAKLMAHIDQPHKITHQDFSDRERDIITLLLSGRSNKEIADELYLSVGTVKNYISQIYLKLDVKDRANAIIALKKIGL